MNARFAAVALTSGLSVVLVSQLFPLPTLGSLVEVDNRSRIQVADGSASSTDRAVNAVQARQVDPSPSADQAPQAHDVPQAEQPPRAEQAPWAEQEVLAEQAPQPDNARLADNATQADEAQKATDAAAVELPRMTDVPQANQTAAPIDAPRAPEAPQSTDASPAAASPPVAMAEIVETPRAAMSLPDAVSDSALNRTDAPIVSAQVASAADTTDAAVADKPQASDTRQSRVTLASADPTENLPAETAKPDAPSAQEHAPDTATRVDFFADDECIAVNACIDRYLWSLYQRAPKEDKMRVSEQRAVTIKRKRKMVTVMRTFTRLVDENFAWKDEAASSKAGMTMEDYVIGGMDRAFKVKLFHVLYAAEEAGLSPGITSAFRDDYRQSIASGLKAANNRSYHGGSLRGGYGHGQAADIVSTKGGTRAERWASTELLWKWVDVHGKDFGIGRPYLGYDPPHVGAIDGQEYISKRGGRDTTREARAEAKPRKQVAARHERASAKRAKVASAKGGKVRSARNTHARAT